MQTGQQIHEEPDGQKEHQLMHGGGLLGCQRLTS